MDRHVALRSVCWNANVALRIVGEPRAHRSSTTLRLGGVAGDDGAAHATGMRMCALGAAQVTLLAEVALLALVVWASAQAARRGCGARR